MPNWKKVIISGSNISQLTNDSGYVLADQVSGSSTLPISNLSASLTSTDQTISASIAALSGSASDARNLLGGGSSTALSSSASTARDVLASQVSGSSVAPIATLSGSLTTTDQIISSSVAALSGSASDARNLLGGASSPWYDGGTFLSSSVDVRITGSLSMVGSEANFETLQVVLPQISQSGNFADDNAAAIGGIVLGGLYRNGNLIAIRLS